MRKNKSVTLKKIWYTYPHRYNPKHSKYVTQKEFTDICKEFNSLLSKLIIEDGYVFKIPARGGHLRIKKFKSNKKLPDFRKTEEVYGKDVWKINKTLPKKERKIVYHTNKHSDGWAGRWWWDMTKWWRYHRLYRFDAVRANNRKVSSEIQDNNSIIHYLE